MTEAIRFILFPGQPDNFADALSTSLGDLSQALVIYDEAVKDLGSDFVAAVSQMGVRVNSSGVPSGEPSKSIDQFSQLLDWMLSSGADRRTVVLAVGGGVIGDLAGFAAASFARGIRFVQVPTTLLAMVDSSVGGKTGINLAGAKNMVGAFWQPHLVWADTQTMGTLPERSYLSGLAEVVKYGVIDDAEFFAWLETNATHLVAREQTALRYAIEQSCLAKARVVQEDERETSGRRAILNYGHTFAHAIEATAGYGELLHGESRLNRYANGSLARDHTRPVRRRSSSAANPVAHRLQPTDYVSCRKDRRNAPGHDARQEGRPRKTSIHSANENRRGRTDRRRRRNQSAIGD